MSSLPPAFVIANFYALFHTVRLNVASPMTTGSKSIPGLWLRARLIVHPPVPAYT